MGFLYSCLTRKAYENGVKDKFEQEKYAWKTHGRSRPDA
jgi:hypothetical protein